jgi:hypothetical protein
MATWKKVLTSGTVVSSELATEGSSGHVLTTDGSGSLSFTAKTTNTDTYEQTEFTLQADSGGGGTVAHGSTVDIAGGSNVSTAYSGNTVTITGTADTVDMGDGFVMRDSADTDVTITEGEFFQIAVVDGSSFGTAVTGSGTTGAPYVMTITAPFEANANTWRGIDNTPTDGETSNSVTSNWLFDNIKTAVPASALFTDTQRAISSTPTDGATTTSISSDWAFDNVKTAVPTSALFTDTNTNTLTTFTLTADHGTDQALAHTNTIDIAGGTNINTGVGATDTVTVNLDASIAVTTISCSDLDVVNLTITGTSTTIETETIALHDNMIVLNSNASGIPTNIDAGIEIERGSAENSRLYYDEVLVGSTDYWGMWKLDRASHGGTWASGAKNHADDAFLGTVSYSTNDPTDGEACFYGQIHVETDTNEIWICTEPLTDDSAGGGGA